ncbi:AAC(3) family N-acetyltransferase [Roseibium porphyridii]|uniref:Aminoglycoside N(3)-acetyltransferase n=1 Tax=Roseibium porphyridii TaxID=2866279 RepID=A0ABY8F7T4_9HYPH|nr:AAC(3) family N-acetyltransferase [Roseibium sp. KMA01]WFE89345.1 AAC(3) family N-acetyltransferase [Roseibium sp. KMA01]
MSEADYRFDHIVDSLRRVGLKQGDVIYSHSNLGFFGRAKDAGSAKQVCSLWLDAIFDVIGAEGTLLVPTFSYSFGSDHPEKLFDVRNTPGVGGTFPEQVRQKEDSIRSLDPMFSVCAIGNRKIELTQDADTEVFGERSVWARLTDLNAIIINLNIDITSTYIHYVEARNKVPYRVDRTFSGTCIDYDGNKYHTVSVFNSRDITQANSRTDCRTINGIAHSRDIAISAKVGRGFICGIRTRDYYDLTTELIETDPYFLTMK